MNRNEARKYVGQHVIINESLHGQYVGVLEEIVARPNTPWEGKVRIVGVFSYPLMNVEKNETNQLIYRTDDIIEIPGKKITILNEPFNQTFDESLAHALKRKWSEVLESNEQSEKALTMIQQELRKLNSEHLIIEDAYVYYQLTKKGRNLYIYDEQKHESLSLDGCPFEFEIKVNGTWKKALYIGGLTFETTSDQEEVELKHGSTVRLNKTQFDPYRILIHELDEPALHALESGLQQLGIGHEHSVYCHNSLLMQLLSSFEQQSFSGVNFLSYANGPKQFVVQHHYERTMKDREPDITFDRFEFTSDRGERVLTTYTTQFSKD